MRYQGVVDAVLEIAINEVSIVNVNGAMQLEELKHFILNCCNRRGSDLLVNYGIDLKIGIYMGVKLNKQSK